MKMAYLFSQPKTRLDLSFHVKNPCFLLNIYLCARNELKGQLYIFFHPKDSNVALM